jgi:protein phosphatase
MRALGIAKDVDVDVRPESIAYVPGDVFVLCSDGLSDLVGPQDILQLAGSQPAAQAAGALVDLANARGGHDNVTVLVMRTKSAAAVSSDSKPTLVKTVAVTRADATPPEKPAGPLRTVLAVPVSGAAMPPPPAHAPMPAPAAIPPAPVTIPPASARADGRPKIALVLAIAAGLLAVGIAIYFVWQAHTPQHVNVPIVEHDAGTAAPAHDDDASAAAPAITTAPPLLPEPAVCTKARLARANNSPAAAKLESLCRAQGGVIAPTTSASTAPAVSAAPAATPTPTIPTTEPIICAEARAARAAGAANASQLEAQCRASGGVP